MFFRLGHWLYLTISFDLFSYFFLSFILSLGTMFYLKPYVCKFVSKIGSLGLDVFVAIYALMLQRFLMCTLSAFATSLSVVFQYATGSNLSLPVGILLGFIQKIICFTFNIVSTFEAEPSPAISSNARKQENYVVGPCRVKHENAFNVSYGVLHADFVHIMSSPVFTNSSVYAYR